MSPPVISLAPPPSRQLPANVSTHPIRPARPESSFSPEVRRWLGLAVGSLLLAGLLSLSVVLGRLPGLSRLIDDPLFFKRCLVVHVDLALVVWFYAFTAALMALRSPRSTGRIESAAWGIAVVGVIALLAGALVKNAAPVLANYLPVLDHPLFLGGLALFFAGVLGFTLRSLGSSHGRPSGGLPADASVGIQACGIALVLAATTWISARVALPAGLDRHTFFEFSHWGAGHVLQLANVSAMLAVWLWLLARATGHRVLSPWAARGLFSLLLLPHFVMPLLSWQGALHRTYIEGATALMRWGLFPVVVFMFVLGLRHLRLHPARRSDPLARAALAGFAASASLTLLGFVLGALIRGSTTLVPAHYHASLGGVTAAFMAAAHLLIEAFGREPGRFRPGESHGRAVRWQLACFGVGQAVFALGFGLAGIYGLGRKAYAGEQHVRTFGEYAGLSVMGLGGLMAAAAGIWFLVLVLRPLCTRRHSLHLSENPSLPALS